MRKGVDVAILNQGIGSFDGLQEVSINAGRAQLLVLLALLLLALPFVFTLRKFVAEFAERIQTLTVLADPCGRIEAAHELSR